MSGALQPIPAGAPLNDPRLDKPWQRCVIYLYTNQISAQKDTFDSVTGADPDTYEVKDWARYTAMHELAHTLKIAHANETEGTVRRDFPTGQGSLMQDYGLGSPPSNAPQDYDVEELRRKVLDTR